MRRRTWATVAAAFGLGALAPGEARAVIGGNDLGINVHVPSNELLDATKTLGVGWIRVDGDWLAMNPASGRFDYAAVDRVVDQANARGLKVYLTLGYTPAWVPRAPRSRADTNPRNDEPATTAEWTAFVRAAVAHYRPKGVRHFGIWNEPNLDQFWENAAGSGPYIDKILVPGAAAVRATCADCFVVGPDLAHVGEYDVFLRPVVQRARGSIDILAHHIYSGWPETGTTVLDGDNFLNALEKRRFSFTRISLRELLDEERYTGEVWITETGYQAKQIGNAGDEGKQATYVRRVMEEQLRRPWWTHTFFYEILDCKPDQADCPIDGFGLLRANRTAPPARTFPADYRQKPAFTAIQQFIAANPGIVAGAPPDAGAPDGGRDASTPDGSATPDAASPPPPTPTPTSTAEPPVTPPGAPPGASGANGAEPTGPSADAGGCTVGAPGGPASALAVLATALAAAVARRVRRRARP
ncbi:MAG: beta-galactosidase [Myxococcales bacterium]|nr:beta-galactosidase [Myxococcales bacterium]MBL0194525.1 beta-galactosidase [Myxococcales bacterium]